jgi:hypothetical protein
MRWLAGPVPGLAGKQVRLSRGLALGLLALLVLAFAVGFGVNGRYNTSRVLRARVAAELRGRRLEEVERQMEEMCRQMNDPNARPKKDPANDQADEEAVKQAEKIEKARAEKHAQAVDRLEKELKHAQEELNRERLARRSYVDDGAAATLRQENIGLQDDRSTLMLELVYSTSALKKVPGFDMKDYRSKTELLTYAYYTDMGEKAVKAGFIRAEDKEPKVKKLMDGRLRLLQNADSMANAIGAAEAAFVESQRHGATK